MEAENNRAVCARLQSECRERIANRKANTEAWEGFLKCKVGTFTCDLCQLPDRELLVKPPTFWYSLRLTDIDKRKQRVMLGRLSDLACTHGRGRFPSALWTAYDTACAMQKIDEGLFDERESVAAPLDIHIQKSHVYGETLKRIRGVCCWFGRFSSHHKSTVASTHS